MFSFSSVAKLILVILLIIILNVLPSALSGFGIGYLYIKANMIEKIGNYITEGSSEDGHIYGPPGSGTHVHSARQGAFGLLLRTFALFAYMGLVLAGPFVLIGAIAHYQIKVCKRLLGVKASERFSPISFIIAFISSLSGFAYWLITVEILPKLR